MPKTPEDLGTLYATFTAAHDALAANLDPGKIYSTSPQPVIQLIDGRVTQLMPLPIVMPAAADPAPASAPASAPVAPSLVGAHQAQPAGTGTVPLGPSVAPLPSGRAV
jgi:hypothetical protein